jgi:hypothetical protein
MGFIEETGAAQHYRDARITTIYEGTTGIQANDFIGRKTARDGGGVARAVAAEMAAVARALAGERDESLAAIGKALAAAVKSCEEALGWMLEAYNGDSRAAHAGAVAYLELWGIATGGWQLARSARIAAAKLQAGGAHAEFLRAKIATARYYAENLLPQTGALAHAVTQGSQAALALAADDF